MKSWITCTVLALMVSVCWAQDNCRPFLPMKVGSTWELTNYTSKGKENGRIAYELLGVQEGNGGTTFSIKSISYDKNDKQTFENTFEAFCKEGVFKYDMTFMMNGEQMQAFETMEVSVDASDFPLPDLDASVGTVLPDASLTIKAITDGPIALQMTIHVTERKVEARESVECPAGKFDCVLLTQKTSTRMMVKIETNTKEWYAPGVGMVRSETYTKKGKLQGYSLLTKFNAA